MDSSNKHGHKHPIAFKGLPSRETDHMPPRKVSRRSMLKLMGASAALAAGVTGCDRKPERKIVSRVSPPEYMEPGVPLFYSSTWLEGMVPYGMVVRTVDGRPVSVEGDPAHPINHGTASAAMKATVLSLYDPDRLRTPKLDGKPATWSQVDKLVQDKLAAAESIVLMTRSTLGPSERALVDLFLEAAGGKAQHFVYDGWHDGPRRRAWNAVYGGPGEIIPLFDKAKVIFSVGSDFLGTDGAVLEATRGFAEHRKPDEPGAWMSRLWVAEGAMSLTGMNADHRIRVAPSSTAALIEGILAAVGGDHDALHAFEIDQDVLHALVDDLVNHRGEALVVAGPQQPEAVHALVAKLNEALGAPGKTITWNPQPHALPVNDAGDIAETLEKAPDVLLMLGVNPGYDWPGGGFQELAKKAGWRVAHTLIENETSALCELVLPSAHNLESWNDAAPRPGIDTLCQPVIRPLFGSRQEAESLLQWTRNLAGEEIAGLRGATEWHGFLKTRWQKGVLVNAAVLKGAERAWEDALRAGGLLKPAAIQAPKLDPAGADRVAKMVPAGSNGLELILMPNPALLDGRFANVAWLHELPDPVSRLVWDNALALAPSTARALGLKEGDRVQLAKGDLTVEAPVLIQRGTADQVGVLFLGGGRTAGGSIAVGAGVSAAEMIQPAGADISEWVATGISISKVGSGYDLVRTQKEFSMHDRPLVLDGTLDEYTRNPAFVDERRHIPEPVKIHKEFEFKDGAHWGMAVDLSSCTGCGACVTACQAENNIPVVGKEECANGREMHWMRIDLYLDGPEDDPVFHRQPVMCQHCDNAPCEMVCPVLATTHSPEGLNEMTYNRCVGTRYCANNCPYKVRRFNFFDYPKRNLRGPIQELAFNPQVTVRTVGVMEKCTFCIQRINEVRFREKKEGKFKTEDGAIKTACQQTCPAQAITFGDMNDPTSRVSELHRENRAYYLLEELNVKPSVAYLAKLRNPHPSLAQKASGGEGTNSRHGGEA
jgi:molybdopterin-containing oxidoreductase family iron-sulfur binding subunit